MKIPLSRMRVTLLAALFSLVCVLFGLRLIKMQIVEKAHYDELANKSTSRKQVVTAARGEIVDRYGRPMAINRTGFNVVLDKAFLTRGRENEVILRLIEIMQAAGEDWIDNLPLTDAQPIAFSGGSGDISRLKTAAGVNQAATAEDVWYWLVNERFGLADYTFEQQRLIAGVRYEMEQRGFNYETPYTFAEDISIDTITKIKENSYDLPGVDVQESSIREYACGDLAPHIIGRIGPIYPDELEEYSERGYAANETVGKEGIEKAFESELRGESGERQIYFRNNAVVDVVETKAPRPGNTVVLTIDKEMQRVVQESLERNIKLMRQTTTVNAGKDATVGSAVVIHVPTGDVLASANYPSYNLATYKEDYEKNLNDPEQPFFDRALQGTYAPGSCFKPCVATGALNEGIATRDTIVNCTGRYMYFAPSYTPSCLYVNGPINVVDALRVSCNYYFYEQGRLLGIDKIDEYAKGFGLGEYTGIELPEQKGRRAGPEYRKSIGQEWYPGDVIQAAIGQSDNKFTPIQIATYCATIANGGKRMRTHMVKSVVSYNFDEVIEEVEPEVAYDMQLADGVIDVVKEGMVAAAGPSGTSLGKFNGYGVTVAAKTGSPQVTETEINSVYIAFAPAENPEVAVAVVIEKGGQGYTGVPIAKDVFDQYFFSDKNAQTPQQKETPLP
ncbi:penicillin-binding protein [Clostridiaceae bacterium NSJ-31]|uniref:Penicillin-binding protein n=5 Tax=Ligaoa zhengdingensis TaxID=2763658 RepID=A0A926DXZ5_9FIRM|nr:penicillin-binding transpeptidase domain-containing protein [Ligaoa zhengdingensis]MBC8546871.1 penicillin-binding protein [Ligaoa zhengdingensis]